ncbi:hypothetical protein RhiirA1_523807, partial [Rhizophagus irregularis]
AKYNLAICYMDGIGTQKDKEKAFDLFLESTIQPYKSTVRSRVGCHFQSGKGAKKNIIRSFKWYLKSAKNGYVKSQICVGSCYECGKGTDKNEIEAFKWY